MPMVFTTIWKAAWRLIVLGLFALTCMLRCCNLCLHSRQPGFWHRKNVALAHIQGDRTGSGEPTAPVSSSAMPERTGNGPIPHSDSLRDVLAVAPPNTLVPKRDALQTRSSGAVLVHESAHHHHTAIQEHENETAEVVLVCEPEGTSLMMGGLHPRCARLVSAVFRRLLQLPALHLLA